MADTPSDEAKDKLEPCPFCGGEAKLDYGSSFAVEPGMADCGLANIRCKKGCCYTTTQSTEQAITAWNTRTRPTVSVEYPAGAIENGREFMRRLEDHYTFTEEGRHTLSNCHEWLELKRCFEHMATTLSHIPQQPAGELVETISDVFSAYSDHDARLCCDGQECACQGATVHQEIQHYLVKNLQALRAGNAAK